MYHDKPSYRNEIDTGEHHIDVLGQIREQIARDVHMLSFIGLFMSVHIFVHYEFIYIYIYHTKSHGTSDTEML